MAKSRTLAGICALTGISVLLILLLSLLCFSTFIAVGMVYNEIDEVKLFLATFDTKLPKKYIINDRLATDHYNLIKCLHDTIKNTNHSFDVAIIGNCSKDIYLLIKNNLLNYKSNSDTFFNNFTKYLKNNTLNDFINNSKFRLVNVLNSGVKVFKCGIIKNNVNYTNDILKDMKSTCNQEIMQLEFNVHNFYGQHKLLTNNQTEKCSVMNIMNKNYTLKN